MSTKLDKYLEAYPYATRILSEEKETYLAVFPLITGTARLIYHKGYELLDSW